jgi:hypothetical protein
MDFSKETLRQFKQVKLSNQAIATLSRLTRQVKDLLGVIKVSDLVNNHRVAFDFFVQTVLSEKDEVVSLTRQVNNEMNIEKHLIDALDAYFMQIKTQDKNNKIIQKNQFFLSKLAHHLYGVKVDGLGYRQAVNQLLLDVNNHEKKFCVDMARSFYPYLLNANRMLTEATEVQHFEDITQKESFIDLWNGLDEMPLSPLANQQLRRYTEAMQNVGLRSKEVEVRKKIAKVILLESLKHHQTAEGYRTNAEAIQTRFTSVRLRDYVAAVTREFYRFWSDTQASK